MRVKLQEVFGNNPLYLMGIAYENIAYDPNGESKIKSKGWEVPYMEVDAQEIDAYATKYGIPSRIGDDARQYWENEEAFKDGMTGEETYYIMIVKNLDGSDISKEDFHHINQKLSEEDEGLGIQIQTPRPLTMV